MSSMVCCYIQRSSAMLRGNLASEVGVQFWWKEQTKAKRTSGLCLKPAEITLLWMSPNHWPNSIAFGKAPRRGERDDHS